MDQEFQIRSFDIRIIGVPEEENRENEGEV